MGAMSIAGKDLLILLKDRGTLLQLFLLPLIFIVVFSGALSAVGADDEQDTRIPLAVVDLDGSELTERFVEDVEAAAACALSGMSRRRPWLCCGNGS